MGRGAVGGVPEAAGSSDTGGSARAGASVHTGDAAGADSVRLTLAGLPACCAPWCPMSCNKWQQNTMPCCYHSPNILEVLTQQRIGANQQLRPTGTSLDPCSNTATHRKVGVIGGTGLRLKAGWQLQRGCKVWRLRPLLNMHAAIGGGSHALKPLYGICRVLCRSSELVAALRTLHTVTTGWLQSTTAGCIKVHEW